MTQPPFRNLDNLLVKGLTRYLKLPLPEGAEYDCPCCLKPYKDGEAILEARTCLTGHFFHETCLLEWLREYKNNTCPKCRHVFFPRRRRMGPLETVSTQFISLYKDWNAQIGVARADMELQIELLVCRQRFQNSWRQHETLVVMTAQENRSALYGTLVNAINYVVTSRRELNKIIARQQRTDID